MVPSAYTSIVRRRRVAAGPLLVGRGCLVDLADLAVATGLYSAGRTRTCYKSSGRERATRAGGRAERSSTSSHSLDQMRTVREEHEDCEKGEDCETGCEEVHGDTTGASGRSRESTGDWSVGLGPSGFLDDKDRLVSWHGQHGGHSATCRCDDCRANRQE